MSKNELKRLETDRDMRLSRGEKNTFSTQVPVVEAPCEAEAQCAELVKEGKAHAVGTEDMDALTFGSTKQLRNMTRGPRVVRGRRLATHRHATRLRRLCGR